MKCEFKREVKRLSEERLRELRGRACNCNALGGTAIPPEDLMELLNAYEGKLPRAGCERAARPGSAFCEEHHQVVLHEKMMEMQNQMAAQQELAMLQLGRMGGEGPAGKQAFTTIMGQFNSRGRK